MDTRGLTLWFFVGYLRIPESPVLRSHTKLSLWVIRKNSCKYNCFLAQAGLTASATLGTQSQYQISPAQLIRVLCSCLRRHHCMRGKRGVRGKNNKNKDKRSAEAEQARLEKAIAKSNKLNSSGAASSAQLGAASSNTDPADAEADSLLTNPLPSKATIVSINFHTRTQR